MLHISQSKISSWVTCERQFQLRYIEKNSWPKRPDPAESVEAMARGELFHALAAQKFTLGERFHPPDFSSKPTLSKWWGDFETFAPRLQAADHYRVESSLAASISSQVQLFGRIDLLIYNNNTLKLFDWKTGRPRSKTELEQDWQTRIYMALLYMSRQTICSEDISPEHISMTYWYARDPNESVTLRFDEAWHAKNQQEMVDIADQITNRLNGALITWPLTTDLSPCGRCSFNSLCGRELASNYEPSLTDDIDQPDEEDQLIELDIHPDL